MAGFGYGFGTGLMGGMSKNIDEDRKNRLIEAQIMGDIQGYQADLPPDQQTTIPTTTRPTSGLGGILGAFGLGGDRTPDMEAMIAKRAMAARQSAVYKQAMAVAAKLTDQIAKGELDVEDPNVQELINKLPAAARLPVQAAVNQQKKQKAQRNILQGIVGTGRVDVPGYEDTEAGMSRGPTTREATRPDVLGAMFGVKGLEDEAAKDYLYRPPPDPTSLIQPGPGTPAAIVNRRTGVVNPLQGTQRPSPAVDPVMNEYRNLRNKLMMNRLKGVETPKDRQQSLLRLIALAQTLKKNADPGSPEEAQYEGDLRRYLSELNQAHPSPSTPAQPGGGGLPQGWRFRD